MAEASSNKVPSFLSEAYLQKALEKAFQTNCIEILNWRCQLANTIGDNFNSNIYRITVNLKIGNRKSGHKEPSAYSTNEKFHFILKDVDPEIAEIITNETKVFEQILPEMERILAAGCMEKQHMKDTSNKLYPSCFFAENRKDYEFYILEDLSALEHKTGSRYVGFSLKQAELVLEKLAKFHATSIVFAEKFPDVVATLKPVHWFEDTDSDAISEALQRKKFDYAMEILEIADESMLKRINKCNLAFNDKVREILDSTKSAFNVLNHGDIWANNIMIREQQSSSDAVFVDFQNVFWGSPSYDLNYFFHTCLSLETFQTQRFTLLEHYYKIFKLVLEALEYKNIPTWSDLMHEFKRLALLGYYAVMCEFPICVMSDEAARGLTAETLLKSDCKWKLVYETPKVRDFIKHAVLYFDEIGLFDN